MAEANPPRLRVLEHYASPQGEGPRTGLMTQFIRFAGCNLKCPSWPCDTQEAIDPKLYRKEQQFLSVHEIIQKAIELRTDTGASNICLTGGEPMLQIAEEISHLVRDFTRNSTEVEMFSNGTISYPLDIIQHCSVVLDWKLPGSGENPEDVVRIDNTKKMIRHRVSAQHVIKFTVADINDLMTAKDIYYRYLHEVWFGEIFVGPVYEKIHPTHVIDFIKQHQLPWSLNIQTHKMIYGNVRSV